MDNANSEKNRRERRMVVGCLGKNGCPKTLRKTRTMGLNPHPAGRRRPRRGRCRRCHHRGGPSRKYGGGYVSRSNGDPGSSLSVSDAVEE
jgi:hypothetical protein